MCGGGGGGGSDPVDHQREQERERQQRIAQGKEQLERIFAGLEGYGYRPETVTRTRQVEVTPERLRAAGYQQKQEPAQSGSRSSGGSRNNGGYWDYTTSGEHGGGARTWREPGYDPDAPSSRGYWDYTTSGEKGGGARTWREPGYDKNAERDKGGYRDYTTSGEHGGGASTWVEPKPQSYWVDPQGNRVDELPDHVDRQYETTEEKRFRKGDPIWEQQQRAYMDYAKPQLEDQYGDAQEQLTYALANQGQLAGSVAGDRQARLGRDYDLRRQEVADKARGVGNQARADVADQKQSLLQMLSASADPGATATAARSAVGSLQNTPEFSPLGPLFQNATAGLAANMGGRQQGQMEQRVQGIQYGRDPDRGSGRVIR